MADAQIVLCDTNILIDLSKRNSEVVRTLKTIGTANIQVSAITAGEFIFGALNKADLNKILKALRAATVLPVNEAISEKGVELVTHYGLSHTLAVPDALIAATALVHNLPLYTLNTKDFGLSRACDCTICSAASGKPHPRALRLRKRADQGVF